MFVTVVPVGNFCNSILWYQLTTWWPCWCLEEQLIVLPCRVSSNITHFVFNSKQPLVIFPGLMPTYLRFNILKLLNITTIKLKCMFVMETNQYILNWRENPYRVDKQIKRAGKDMEMRKSKWALLQYLDGKFMLFEVRLCEVLVHSQCIISYYQCICTEEANFSWNVCFILKDFTSLLCYVYYGPHTVYTLKNTTWDLQVFWIISEVSVKMHHRYHRGYSPHCSQARFESQIYCMSSLLSLLPHLLSLYQLKAKSPIYQWKCSQPYLLFGVDL